MRQEFVLRWIRCVRGDKRSNLLHLLCRSKPNHYGSRPDKRTISIRHAVSYKWLLPRWLVYKCRETPRTTRRTSRCNKPVCGLAKTSPAEPKLRYPHKAPVWVHRRQNRANYECSLERQVGSSGSITLIHKLLRYS